jgi:hypothetical protein
MDIKNTSLRQLQEKLNLSDDSKLINEIKRLRDREAIPGAILLLRDIFEKTGNESVRKEIENFFNDLKHQDSVNEVINAIDSAGKEHTKQVLISSCWQSGLDYSAHLHRFVDYSINLDYLCALECYSVIEEWTGSGISEDTMGWIKLINDSLNDQTEEKKALLKAIVSLLQ